MGRHITEQAHLLHYNNNRGCAYLSTHFCLIDAMQDALVRAGIQPDEHIRYSSADIVAAIEEQLGSQPLVHCSRGSLTEVRQFVRRPHVSVYVMGAKRAVHMRCAGFQQRWL